MALLGMGEDTLRELDDGARKMYSKVSPKVEVDRNPALQLADPYTCWTGTADTHKCSLQCTLTRCPDSQV